MNQPHALFFLALLALGCGGGSHEKAVAAVPMAIAIAPQSHGSMNPEDVQLTARATYPDGTERDVTSRVTWSVGDGYFGGSSTVSASGLFHWTSTPGYRDQVRVTAILGGVASDEASVYFSQY